MLTALLVGAIASSALVIGGILGAFWRPPQRLLAVVMGFAAGALIIAVAFDLFEKSFKAAGPLIAGGSLVVGAAAFMGATELLDRYSSSTSGFYLLANILLDGIPENLAMGVALIGKPLTGILSLVVAIFFSNFPEALGGAVGMRDSGRSKKFAIISWSVTAVVLAIMVVIGNAVFSSFGEVPLAAVRALAAGAVLAGLAEAIMPQAYGEGGKIVAIATTAGFLLTFLITQ
ncbi:ZIP family metal transporter [Rubrobacter aplysinae]|uniref:ZIP family metal transporter n=1 Tax=Rubrobacter aplysinae TaxID=909625 RepID=UPI00064BDB48|nr:hypothetical protein [Rubrobacter aplysinae]